MFISIITCKTEKLVSGRIQVFSKKHTSSFLRSYVTFSSNFNHCSSQCTCSHVCIAEPVNTHTENFRCWLWSRLTFCCILCHVPDTLVSVLVSTMTWRSALALQCSIRWLWELVFLSFCFVVSFSLTPAWMISSTVNSRSSLLVGLKSLKSIGVSSWKSSGKWNRHVGCFPRLILMQYAVLHFVWGSTELKRDL